MSENQNYLVRMIHGRLLKVNGVFFDDEGDVVSVCGQLLEPKPGEGSYAAFDMRGHNWPPHHVLN